MFESQKYEVVSIRSYLFCGVVILLGAGLAKAESEPVRLESPDPVVGTITIENGSIFDLENPEENNFLYRLANKAHATTRPQVIEQQLLFEPVASQIDLAPTLLSMIGLSSAHPMIGHDLSSADALLSPGRAIMQFNSTQAYMEGGRVTVLQKDKPAQEYVYDDGRLEVAETQTPGLAAKALAHASWSSLAYEKSLYRLPLTQTAFRESSLSRATQ